MSTRVTPKIPLGEYLDLLERMKITRDPRFKLVNQEVHNGYVYFRTPNAIKAVKELAHCWETNTIPEREILLQQKADKEFEKRVGIPLSDIMTKLESFRGPDSHGWYTARCPVCADKGGDSDHDHLRIQPEKGIRYCFNHCDKGDIDIWLLQLSKSDAQ